MKLLTVIALIFILTFAAALPRRHRKNGNEKRRIVHRHDVRNEHKHEGKHESAKSRGTEHRGSKKNDHKVYKKFGMFAAPSFALEDSSAAQGQGQPAWQPVLVPVNSFTQNTPSAQEMVSAYNAAPSTFTAASSPFTTAPSTLTAPSQRATLGTEVVGDQANTQTVATQTAQPQTVQPQTVQYEGAPLSTNEDNSALKASTQGATLQEETGATPTEIVGSPVGSLDTGSQGIQSFTQQDSGKGIDEMKDLQMYNGPLPDSGQSKPRIEGVSPQEEIKIVNLGDDEKTANLQQGQDKDCGGCPAGAKCVNGQCQIREEDAQAQGLTGKGTANNPGSLNDIHNLETEELTSLLKDASKAGTSSVTESPVQGHTQNKIQTQTIETGPQHIDTEHQEVQFTKTPSTQQVAQQPATIAQQPATIAQPHFTSEQLKELRDFARMYKMYQFIRKMEERLNDPDCAPVCRKSCKNFCPAKCCHGQKVNTSVVSHLMQTADKMKATGNKASAVGKPKKVDPSGMEDNGGDNQDTEEQEEKAMDKNTAGKKHILIRIVKNDVLDRPRSDIRENI